MLIGITKAAWETLTQREKNVLKFVVEHLQLGDPAIYVDTSDDRHYTFSDGRMRVLDYAVIGCFAANRADLPGAYTLPLDGEGNIDRPQLRTDIVSFITNPARTTPFVHPNNVTPSDPDAGVTPQDVLAANGAPAAIFAELDPTWVVYDPETHGAV